MRTERQKQAARANGARSRGPITPEGKLASSRNAMTHGLLAGTVVLEGESVERFHALLDNLLAELQPQTTVETTLVENMAVARWRQMRIWGIEKANMEHQMRVRAETGCASEDEDNATRCALAFRTLGDDSCSLELINRYESRYDRQYLRAHRRFLELVDRRTPPPPPHKPPVPEPRNTISAKQTRQPVTPMPSNRFAAVAGAIILVALSFLPGHPVGRAFSPQPPFRRLSEEKKNHVLWEKCEHSPDTALRKLCPANA